MAVKFDNLDDVVGKFLNTICYYDGRPVKVDNIQHSDDIKGSFTLLLKGELGPHFLCDISDPLFNYRDFNLGYANLSQYATWLYRKPLKQYQQGLKRNQVAYLSGLPMDGLADDGFGFSKNYLKMLKDVYPSMKVCAKQVKAQARRSAAFHRDFALSYNLLHEDFTLEFRGKNIGISGDLKYFKLAPEHEYLRETLHEVLMLEERKVANNGD